mmetsp:Transcript_105653/g.340738  ORF Transcript_105653/g.340738 Transcript_105653/m.340738 type:complete len:210 (-) Transcript_105653:1316-1945(-)
MSVQDNGCLGRFLRRSDGRDCQSLQQPHRTCAMGRLGAVGACAPQQPRAGIRAPRSCAAGGPHAAAGVEHRRLPAGRGPLRLDGVGRGALGRAGFGLGGRRAGPGQLGPAGLPQGRGRLRGRAAALRGDPARPPQHARKREAGRAEPAGRVPTAWRRQEQLQHRERGAAERVHGQLRVRGGLRARAPLPAPGEELHDGLGRRGLRLGRA